MSEFIDEMSLEEQVADLFESLSGAAWEGQVFEATAREASRNMSGGLKRHRAALGIQGQSRAFDPSALDD